MKVSLFGLLLLKDSFVEESKFLCSKTCFFFFFANATIMIELKFVALNN